MKVNGVKKRFQKLFCISCFFFLFSIGLGLLQQVNASEDILVTIERDPTSGSSQNPKYIRGTFTLHATGPDDLSWIAIYFNETLQHNVTGSTIDFQFNTEFYPEGYYDLYSIGQNGLGETITSNHIQIQFKQESSGSIWYILGGLGLLAIIVAIYHQKTLKDSKKSVKKNDVDIKEL